MNNSYRVLICWATLVLLYGLCPAQGPIEFGPYVSQVTTESIAITWITNQNTSDNKVIWGTDTPDTEAPEDSSEKNPHVDLWNHIVYLTGLSANTDYTYKVTSDGNESTEYSFRSAVNWGESFGFGYAADNQSKPAQLGHNLEESLQKGAHFFIYGADLLSDASKIYDGNGSWEGNLFQVANRYPNDFEVSKNYMASHAVYNTVSWHDLGMPDPEESGVDHYSFFWTFPANGLPWSNDLSFPERYRQENTYAFGYGNVYFICVSETQEYRGEWVGGVTGEDQVDWIREHLEIGKRDYAFRVVYSHFCLYAFDWENARIWEELLPEYDVNIHFHGHEHSYMHNGQNGVDHICGPTSGRGDWALITADSEQMRFTAYRENGDVMGESSYDADPDVEPPVKVSPAKKTGRIAITPSAKGVYIDLPETASASDISIHDCQGKLIASLKGSQRTLWDISGVKNGMYFITHDEVTAKWVVR